jgi:preprotein translocase subunit SecD
LYQNPQSFEWGILLTFTNSGGSAFRDMIRNADEFTFIYRNGEEFSRVNVGDKTAGSNNTAVITLGTRANGQMPSRQDAVEFQRQIESGLFAVSLDIAEMSIISQTLGAGALMGCIIALAIGLIFMLIFMYLRYGDLGLLSNLSLCVFMVLFLLALAITPAVQLTLPGIAGIVLAVSMAVDANIIIFERIRDEYQTGKRLSVAVKSGFDRSLWTIFDSNITTIIGAGVLWFLGTGPIMGFAITLMLGVVISMYCSLVVTRSLAKLYLVVNPTNARRMRLTNNNPYITEIDNTPKPRRTTKRQLNLGGAK